MISIDDFRKEDGRTDWTAFYRARKEAGEICRQCSSCIIFSSGPGLCNECRHMRDSTIEVEHSRYVRCPKCQDKFSARESEMYELYEEGGHEILCQECDHEFEVVTNVSYSFRSPELAKEEATPPSEEE